MNRGLSSASHQKRQNHAHALSRPFSSWCSLCQYWGAVLERPPTSRSAPCLLALAARWPLRPMFWLASSMLATSLPGFVHRCARSSAAGQAFQNAHERQWLLDARLTTGYGPCKPLSPHLTFLSRSSFEYSCALLHLCIPSPIEAGALPQAKACRRRRRLIRRPEEGSQPGRVRPSLLSALAMRVRVRSGWVLKGAQTGRGGAKVSIARDHCLQCLKDLLRVLLRWADTHQAHCLRVMIEFLGMQRHHLGRKYTMAHASGRSTLFSLQRQTRYRYRHLQARHV